MLFLFSGISFDLFPILVNVFSFRFTGYLVLLGVNVFHQSFYVLISVVVVGRDLP